MGRTIATAHTFKVPDGTAYEVAYQREPWGAHAYTLSGSNGAVWYCQDWSRIDHDLAPDEVREYARGVVLAYLRNVKPKAA